MFRASSLIRSVENGIVSYSCANWLLNVGYFAVEWAEWEEQI